jgi:hypothetical protein
VPLIAADVAVLDGALGVDVELLPQAHRSQANMHDAPAALSS